MTFPVRDPAVLAEMFAEIGDVVQKHLGFFPPRFVLILHDGKQVQTMFAGDDPADMTRLLIGSADVHRLAQHEGQKQ